MKMKKNEVKKSTKISWSRVIILTFITLLIINMTVFAGNVGATNPTGDTVNDFDTIVKFIAGWIGKIGLVVAFLGAVQFGFAFKNDDADGKTKAIRTLASGFIVFALTQALHMFGIN